MKKRNVASQGSAAKAQPGLSYRQMSPRQKVKFIAKLAVCILSFGFVFPNVMHD
jgi:hypothetical protein